MSLSFSRKSGVSGSREVTSSRNDSRATKEERPFFSKIFYHLFDNSKKRICQFFLLLASGKIPGLEGAGDFPPSLSLELSFSHHRRSFPGGLVEGHSRW
jgi:hypothetical protein